MCDAPYYVLPKSGSIEKVPVGCGRCAVCKRKRVNGWVFRMMKENERSTNAHFITLTYDTDHVPLSGNKFPTLVKSHFQDYMKRLRKLCPDNHLKYYACGEYGETNFRPHFHAIIFNCPESKFYADAWSLNGIQFGRVHVGSVTSDSVAYCMKYIDKADFKRRHYRDDRNPEFALMSKGLGSNFLTDNMINYFRSDLSRLYIIKEGGFKIGLPRYYRAKIFNEDQMLTQGKLVRKAVKVQDFKERLEYYQTYGGKPPFSFTDYKELEREGRYVEFHANRKTRNL